MSTKINKKKMFKLITGILIPIFIMAASIVMVGVSYAWFSMSATTTVSTITMSTEEAFTLSFDFGSDPEEMYEGELAYVTKNNVTHLVTDQYATTVLGYTNPSSVYEGYMQDAPYTVGANVILDTQGKRVDFEVYINSVNIYMEDDKYFDRIKYCTKGHKVTDFDNKKPGRYFSILDESDHNTELYKICFWKDRFWKIAQGKEPLDLGEYDDTKNCIINDLLTNS